MFRRTILSLTKKLVGNVQPSRGLKIHEYTAMELLQKYDIPVPKFMVARTPEDVEKACKYLAETTPTHDVVVKAQVLAGGRGKGVWDTGLKGGVKIAFSVDEALNLAKRMLGHRIYTVQTGEAGQTCNTLLVCERKYSRREHYFAIVLDRELGGPVMLGCEQGGVDIEGLARDQPEALIKMPIDIDAGLSREDAVQMAIKLNFTTPDLVQQGATYIERLYKLFSETDCSLLEINPIAQDIHDQINRCLQLSVNRPRE